MKQYKYTLLFMGLFICFQCLSGDTFAQTTSSPQKVSIKETNDKAKKLLWKGDIQKAIELWLSAIDLNQTIEASMKAEILNNLGFAYYQYDWYESAEYYLQSAKQIAPDRWSIYLNLADLYYDSDFFQQAIKNYEILLDLNPNYKYRDNIIKKINQIKNDHLDFNLYSLDEIKNDLKMNNEKLMFQKEVILDDTERPDYLITFHNIKIDSIGIVVIVWAQVEKKFKKVLELLGSHYDEFQIFKYGDNHFVKLLEELPGSGLYTEETVFCVLPDNTWQKIPFDRADNGYIKGLKKNQYVRKAYSNFTDNEMNYTVTIANENDPNCCPSGGSIYGTYNLTGKMTLNKNKNIYDTSFIITGR